MIVVSSSPCVYITGFWLNDFWLSYGPWKNAFYGMLKKYNVQLYNLGNSHFLHIVTEITQASIYSSLIYVRVMVLYDFYDWIIFGWVIALE